MIFDVGTTPRIPIYLVDSTDHVTPKTGATVTVQLSKNGAAFATASGSVTEIGNGWYRVTLTAAETDTPGPLLVRATATGADTFGDYHQVAAGIGNLANIASGLIEMVSPVADTGEVELVQGDDYDDADGRELTWTNAEGSWPDLTSATIALKMQDRTDGTDKGPYTGAVNVASGAGQQVQVELTDTQTAALEVGAERYDYQVVATLSSARVVTLARGTVTVREDL